MVYPRVFYYANHHDILLRVHCENMSHFCGYIVSVRVITVDIVNNKSHAYTNERTLNPYIIVYIKAFVISTIPKHTIPELKQYHTHTNTIPVPYQYHYHTSSNTIPDQYNTNTMPYQYYTSTNTISVPVTKQHKYQHNTSTNTMQYQNTTTE